MVPDFRPSSPLSTGPTRFFASGPTRWQGRHFLNEVSPAARSCADTPFAASNMIRPANAQTFISHSFNADAHRTIRYIGMARMMLRQNSATDIRGFVQESVRSSPMTLRMPEPDAAVLARRAEIVRDLSAIVPGEGVISNEREMRPYESDGLTAYRQLPFIVVLPETTEQVSRVLRYCHEHGIKVVPRGAGTSLSGGALPLSDGVLLGMGKFNRIREIDYDNRVAVVEPGVTNLAISQAVAHE